MFATPLTGALIAANNNRASLAFLYEWIARYAYHTDERAACRSAPKSYFASPIKPVTSAHLSQDDPPDRPPCEVRIKNRMSLSASIPLATACKDMAKPSIVAPPGNGVCELRHLVQRLNAGQ